jgi:hypothetical protein
VRRVLHDVKSGDVVYVKTDLQTEFFQKIYPNIHEEFILVTHNSDYETNVALKHYLDQDKIIAWLGPNPGFEHPKHIPLPLGLENTVFYPSKIEFIRALNVTSLIPWEKRKYLVYLNFNSGTNPGARKYLFDLFKDIPGVLISQKRLDYASYMNHIGDSKFVLCPRGNGLDTHRFYETIIMGSIPVVENSTLFPLFRDANALILSSFGKLTIKTLKEFKINTKSYALSRNVIMWKTWKDRINALRT